MVRQPKTTLLPIIYEYYILKLKNDKTCFTLPSIYLCPVSLITMFPSFTQGIIYKEYEFSMIFFSRVKLLILTQVCITTHCSTWQMYSKHLSANGDWSETQQCHDATTGLHYEQYRNQTHTSLFAANTNKQRVQIH